MIELFEIAGLKVYLSNIIYVLLSIAFTIFLSKFVNNKLRHYLRNLGWKMGRDRRVLKLFRQFIYLLGALLVYRSAVANNENLSFSDLLSIQIFHPIKVMKDGEVHHLFDITVGSIVLIIAMIFIAKMLVTVSRIVIHRAAKEKEWIDETRRYTIVKLTKYFIYTIIFILCLGSLGIDTSILVAASTALFVGLGLGLRDAFTDVVSGIILLFDGTVRVGDVIELSGEICKVQSIHIRTSQVKTLDGKMIIVPNSKLTEENVVNWTVSDKVTRFHIDVSVAYGSDTMKVKEILYDCALKHPMVDKKRNITIMFDDFGENGLHFQLYFWASRTWEIQLIKSELRFQIDNAFRNEGVRIPFPQRDVHIIGDQQKPI